LESLVPWMESLEKGCEHRGFLAEPT